MQPLLLEKTQDTPGVVLDKSENNFMFSGTSMPENASKFFNPILDWIEKYIETPNEETILNFKMDYFNTASTKVILDIMIHFKEISKKGKTLLVNWYFIEEDDDMLEAGKGFSNMLRFPFNFIKR